MTLLTELSYRILQESLAQETKLANTLHVAAMPINWGIPYIGEAVVLFSRQTKVCNTRAHAHLARSGYKLINLQASGVRCGCAKVQQKLAKG